ncbi:MAG: TIGR03643 family protein [Spirosomataceae bacterium]
MVLPPEALQNMGKITLSDTEIDRLIEMAWEDRTPFDAIERQFGLGEAEVIALMRRHLQPDSWRRWRKRVNGRKTKHAALSASDDLRFRCSRQRSISRNKVSKRGR